jgi:hypothetical protein
MRIATTAAPAGLAELLAPAASAGPTTTEPRAAEPAGAPAEPTAAFDALLAALVMPGTVPAPAPAPPEPPPAESTDVAASDAGDAAPGARVRTPVWSETHAQADGDAGAVDALHYGLRTDAQLGGLADELSATAEAPARRDTTRDVQRDVPRDTQRDARVAPATGRDADAHATRAEPAAAERAAATATELAAERARELEAEPAIAPAPAAPRATTSAPERDAEALAPELQARLGRVVARMRNEFGHEVEVAETHGTQARRDALHAQSRTAPDSAVTWTRPSRHTSGRAEDVRADGGWDDAEAFRLLQRVAGEEGLKTLGRRDAGHLELPRHADATGAVGATAADALLDEAVIESLAVAPPAAAPTASAAVPAAAVPTVAAPQLTADVTADATAVAEAARVAEVATAAGTQGVVAQAAKASHATGDGEETGTGTRATRSSRAATPAAARRARDGARDDASDRAADASAPSSTTATAAPAAAHGPRAAVAAPPVLGAAAVDRVTRVTDRFDAAAAERGVSHLTLQLDGAAGEDRIRVDVRGLGVQAQIDLGDAGAAERLAARIDDLRQSLERQGLTADAVRIGGALRATEPAAMPAHDAARVAAAAAAAPSDAGASGNASQSQHQQGSRDSAAREAAQQQRDAQQHGSRDGRRQQGGAEPWFADDLTPPARGRPAR